MHVKRLNILGRLLTGCWLVCLLACERPHVTQTRLDLSPIRIPSLNLPIPKDNKPEKQLAALRKEFLDICEKNAREVLPPRPLEVAHIYVFDATKNVTAMWGFNYFEDIDKSRIALWKTEDDISIVTDLSEVIPRQGYYIWKRSVLEQVTHGDFTFRGVKQEIIDSLTGEVKAMRINYYLGADLARGVSCLDSNWKRGFDSFLRRAIGFMPPFPRSDEWVKETPELFVQAKQKGKRPSSAAEFSEKIYPTGAVYDYNSRTITINDVAHYLRQKFNNEPLRMVGVQSFPNRTLISYETNALAPSVLIQIRNRETGQLLQEIYVKIPLSVVQPGELEINAASWRLANNSLKIKEGKLLLEIIKVDPDDQSKYISYQLEAPWPTEDIGLDSLPPHLNDEHWGAFAIPKNKISDSINEQQIAGRWRSSPAGTIWEFFEDGRLHIGYWEKRGQWKMSGNQLTADMVAGSYDPNKRTATFKQSKDGRFMEVTLQDAVGKYEPFLLVKLD